MTCRCRSGECDPECDGPMLRAEIERLRAELDKAHRLCGQFIGWQRDLYIANAKLAQQVNRLQDRLCDLDPVAHEEALEQARKG